MIHYAADGAVQHSKISVSSAIFQIIEKILEFPQKHFQATEHGKGPSDGILKRPAQTH